MRYGKGIWTATGALFQTNINDLAERTGQRDSRYDITTKGYKLSLARTVDKGFVRANFTHANVEENGEPIGTTAFYRGRPTGSILALEAGYDLDDQWRTGGNIDAAFENKDAEATLEGYETVNAYATFQPLSFENMDIRLDIKNLFNATYVARNSDAADGSLAIPLKNPGRTITLTAKIRF